MTHLQAVSPPMPTHYYKVTVSYRLSSDAVSRPLHCARLTIDAPNAHEAGEAAIAQVRASGGIVKEVVSVEKIDQELLAKKLALGLV